MLDTPDFVDVASRPYAFIHLTVPRSEIRHVMGPGIQELMSTIAAQSIPPDGPWFTHHLRVDPEVFDFEIGIAVPRPVQPAGRVQAGMVPPMRVVRTVYHGPYEGLGAAWGEFIAWIEAQKLQVSGDLWERYLAGPESGPDSTRWRTELSRSLVG